jgi:hypothetical protein
LALKLMDADAEPVILVLIRAAKGGGNQAGAGAGGAVASQPAGAIRHAANRNAG